MKKVWIRTHVSTGEVSVHSEPPRPHMDNMREEKYFNQEGEEVTNYFAPDSSLRFTWVKTVLFK